MKDSLRHRVITSICLAACLTLIFVPAPVTAQSSALGLSISVNPTTAAPGSTVGVFAFVTNNTGARLRQTVTISSLSPCGIQNQIGYNKVVLSPGQTVQVTVSYPLAPNACTGSYAVTISAPGSKGAPGPSATGYFTVQ